MWLRYLAAFGPASVADIANWSRLGGWRQVVEQTRPHLVTFRNERGTELFDLPHAPRPAPDTPAPVRFLPEYDNLLLGHADRSRFSGGASFVGATRGIKGTVLIDGTVQAIWRFEGGKNARTLVVEHWPLAKADLLAVAEEANNVGLFWHPDSATSIELREIQ